MVRVSEAGTGQDGAGFEAKAIVVRVSEAGTDLATVLVQANKIRLGLLIMFYSLCLSLVTMAAIGPVRPAATAGRKRASRGDVALDRLGDNFNSDSDNDETIAALQNLEKVSSGSFTGLAKAAKKVSRDESSNSP